MPKKKGKNCKKSYPCGASCISLRYACRKSFTEGVSVSIDGTRQVIMNNIKQESESEVKPPAPAPAPAPEAKTKPEPKKEEIPKSKPKKETPKEDPEIKKKEEAAETFLKDANQKKAFKERLEGEAKDLKKELQELNRQQIEFIDQGGNTDKEPFLSLRKRNFEAINELKDKYKEIQKLGNEYDGLMAKGMGLKGEVLATKLGNKTSYKDVGEGVNGKRSKEAKELHEDLRAIANGDKPKHTKKGEELEDLRSKYGRFLDTDDNRIKANRLKDEGLKDHEAQAVAQWLHVTNYDIINKLTRDDKLSNSDKEPVVMDLGPIKKSNDGDKEAKAQMLKDLNTGIMKLKKQTYNPYEMQSIAQSRKADTNDLRTDGRLVRGIMVPKANEVLDSFRSKIGKEHYEPTVMGTTALKDDKIGFVEQANVKFSVKPKMKSNGVMVDEFKNYAFEGEVLFPSNTRFGVVDVVDNTVYLQEL